MLTSLWFWACFQNEKEGNEGATEVRIDRSTEFIFLCKIIGNIDHFHKCIGNLNQFIYKIAVYITAKLFFDDVRMSLYHTLF